MPTPIKNIEGQVFGYLTVISTVQKRNSSGDVLWMCECICGKRLVISGSYLRNGSSKKSCGCRPARYDLTGRTFGFLSVLTIDSNKPRQAGESLYWNCLCCCGQTVSVVSQDLRYGHTKSCGCKKGYLSFQTRYKNKIEPTTANFNKLFASHKTQSRRRKIPTTLTREEFRLLTSSNCHYCGEKPTRIINYSNDVYPYICNGLDRKNPNKTYTLDNVVPCCWTCNLAKGIRSYEDYHDWIARSARHMFIENKKQRG